MSQGPAQQTHALLIYDMTQNRIDPTERRFSQSALDGMPGLATLVQSCRQSGVTICYAVGARALPDYKICDAIAPQPNDKLFIHPKSGAFFHTELEQALRERGHDTLLITGIALDYGLSSTAREALALGIRPVLVRGACYTYDIVDSPVGLVTKEDLERAHLASLSFMGASVISIEDAISAVKNHLSE